MGKRPEDGWTDDPRDELRAGPEFDLAEMDRGATPGWKRGKKAAKRSGDDRGDLLSELQERLFAEGRAGGQRSLLVVVQGLDTAGKGGVARHVMSKVDPQGVALRPFGPPTEEEQEPHFFRDGPAGAVRHGPRSEDQRRRRRQEPDEPGPGNEIARPPDAAEHREDHDEQSERTDDLAQVVVPRQAAEVRRDDRRRDHADRAQDEFCDEHDVSRGRARAGAWS